MTAEERDRAQCEVMRAEVAANVARDAYRNMITLPNGHQVVGRGFRQDREARLALREIRIRERMAIAAAWAAKDGPKTREMIIAELEDDPDNYYPPLD